MQIKLESEGGEFLCDLDLTDEQVFNMIEFAILNSQKEKIDLGINLPLKEEDIIKLIKYSIITKLKEEIEIETKKQEK